MNTDEVEIRELVTAEAAALRARDARAVVARYAPQVVKFDLAPPLRHTGSEVTDPAGLEQWLSGFTGPVQLDVTDLQVTAGADVAFCHSLNRLAATPQGAPEGFEMWFRATVGLRKVDGAWVITHEHTSTPFHMDGSFRAATDLTP
jgi:ketosteroid isomerase-like protein